MPVHKRCHTKFDGKFRRAENNVATRRIQSFERQRQPAGIGRCNDYLPHLQKPFDLLSGNPQESRSHG